MKRLNSILHSTIFSHSSKISITEWSPAPMKKAIANQQIERQSG
jgi:hypothetical protein